MQVLSLCSGYGGLELALQRILTPAVPVAFCDIYGPARQVLETHYPDVPIYRDVLDPALKEIRAGAVTFGFPCQDLSNAGNRAGLIEGKRSSLFFSCMEVVEAVRPQAVFIENVPQLQRYRDIVDGTLRDLRLEPRWATVKACEAGLPHKRECTFIAAVRGGSSWLGNCATAPAQQDVEPSFPTPTVMDMGWGRSRDEWSTWIDNQRAKHRNGNGHGRSLYQLCGEGTLLVMEHLMGLPTGYITNQGLSVGAQRKLLGNGVAPAQGALGLYRALQQF